MAESRRPVEKLIVIGGSAGSLEVLFQILPLLRVDFPYPIIIVLHRKAAYDTVLAELFATKTTLMIREIEDKETIDNSIIYLAPGDYHLLFEKDGTLSLDDSEKVAFSRPSIDVAFESASTAWGRALICILLSGANADGTEGLRQVKGADGMTVVQSPESAGMGFMPRHAIAQNVADFILNVQEIADFMNKL